MNYDVVRLNCVYFVLLQNQKGKIKMERKISQGRKLSTDMQRKLSAISNCSDVSNLSVMLGMDPNDFKSTIQNILGKFFLLITIKIGKFAYFKGSYYSPFKSLMTHLGVCINHVDKI